MYVPARGLSTITAYVQDAQGLPVPAEAVTFATDLGTIKPDLETTGDQDDQAGVARSTLTCPADTPGLATITVQAGEVETQLPVVCFSPADLSLEFSSADLPAQQGAQSIVTARVRDAGGTLIPQQSVQISTTLGSINPAESDTDANGQASFTLTPPADLETGMATIRASSGRISATRRIAIAAVPLAGAETNYTPATAWHLNLGTAYRIAGPSDGRDVDDYYRLDLDGPRHVQLFLRDIPAGADYELKLIDGNQWTMVGESLAIGNADELLEATLPAGTYYLQVERRSPATRPTEMGYIVGGRVIQRRP
jgi:hypothetical protein